MASSYKQSRKVLILLTLLALLFIYALSIQSYMINFKSNSEELENIITNRSQIVAPPADLVSTSPVVIEDSFIPINVLSSKEFTEVVLSSTHRPLPVGRYNGTIWFKTSQPLFKLFKEPVNPHPFQVKLIPKMNDLCQLNSGDRKLLLVILVAIGPELFDKRMIIRSTWGNSSLFNETRLVFCLGMSRSLETNDKIRNESDRYGDILQEDFMDSYNNLTIKVMAGFKYVAYNCPNAQFVLRVNQDIIVNTPRLTSYLKNLLKQNNNNVTNLAMGNIYDNNYPIRYNSKYQVTVDEYQGDKFFPYMEGTAYLVSSDLAANAYQTSLSVNWPPFSVWLEDIYLGRLQIRHELT